MTILTLMLVALVIGMIVGGILASMHQRIRQLEQAQKGRESRPRLPYKVNDGLEDAISVLLELQQESDYLQVRMKQVHKILAVLRGSPDEYDPEQPNGKRSQ